MRTSVDLNLTQTHADLTDEGVALPDGRVVPWAAIEEAAANETGCFLVEGDAFEKIQTFSEDTGRVITLYPTPAAPTILISGISMHRIKGSNPYQDTLTKVRAIAPISGRVLDTTTGLGYTACQASRSARRVITIELDPAVLAIARLNPWSKELFESEKIEQLLGDSVEVVNGFRDEAFDCIIHDPPQFSLAGELYSGEFYAQLLRALARREAVPLHRRPGEQVERQRDPQRAAPPEGGRLPGRDAAPGGVRGDGAALADAADCPGASDEVDRAVGLEGNHRPQALASCAPYARPRAWRRNRGGPLPAEEGRPVVFEVTEDGWDVDGARLDFAQASLGEAGGECFRVADREAISFVQHQGFRIDRDGCVPEVAHEIHLAGVVPDVNGDGATRTHDARHLLCGIERFRHEVEHEPETAASKEEGGSGMSWAAPTPNSARGSVMFCARLPGIPARDRFPLTAAGSASASMVSTRAPVPQPTSSQRCLAGRFSQVMNSRATGRLQRPT